MSLKIAQLGQPVLRRKADPVPVDEISTPAFQQFLEDMEETLHVSRGVGLAAPQVFASRRVFLAAVEIPASKNDPLEAEVFINPRLTDLSPEMETGWEGCLSFLELLVIVPRHRSLRIEYLDRNAKPRTLSLSGFAARVVQHEFDHLDGILTIDRAATTRHIIKASEVDTAREQLKTDEKD